MTLSKVNEQMARPAQFATCFGHFHSSSSRHNNPQRQIINNSDHTAGLSADPGFHSVAQALSSVHDSAQPLEQTGNSFSNPVGGVLTKSCPGMVPRRRGGRKVSMGCWRSGDQRLQKKPRNDAQNRGSKPPRRNSRATYKWRTTSYETEKTASTMQLSLAAG